MDADSRVSVRASTPLRVGLTISALGLLLGSTPIAHALAIIWDRAGYLLNQIPGLGPLTDPGSRLRVHMTGEIAHTISPIHLILSGCATTLLVILINARFIHRTKTHFHDKLQRIFVHEPIALSLLILCMLSVIARASLESAGAHAWNAQSGESYTNPLPFSVGPAAMLLHLFGLLLVARIIAQLVLSALITRPLIANNTLVPSCPKCGYPTSDHLTDVCPECGKAGLHGSWSILYVFRPNPRNRIRVLVFRSSIAVALYSAPAWWFIFLSAFQTPLRLFVMPFEWLAFIPWWIFHWIL